MAVECVSKRKEADDAAELDVLRVTCDELT